MKIALCAPTNIHALATYLKRDLTGVVPGLGSTATTPLIIELLKRGHQLTVYTLTDNLSGDLFYDWGNLRIFVGGTRRLRHFYRPQVNYLARVIREDAPAFVHAHWTYEFALGALHSGVPSIVTIHDLPWRVLWYFRDACRTVRLLMAYRAAWIAKQFTAVSPDAAAHFRRWLRPDATIQVIPNFLQDWIFELGEREPAQQSRPFTFVTLLQGWSKRKNGASALRAFELYRKNNPDARLVLLGADYEHDGAAERWAKTAGIDTSGIDFRGELPYQQMLNFLVNEADVLVHPSLDESFSMAALECMALKIPVIAGVDTPGVRWVLDFGRVGELVNVRSPEALALAMEKLHNDEPYRKRLTDLALSHARGEFSAGNVISQYERLYEDLLDPGTRPFGKRHTLTAR